MPPPMLALGLGTMAPHQTLTPTSMARSTPVHPTMVPPTSNATNNVTSDDDDGTTYMLAPPMMAPPTPAKQP